MNDASYFIHQRTMLPKEKLNGVIRLLGIAGSIVLLISLLGLAVNKSEFFHAWLFSFLFYFGLCTGSLFWVILHYVTNAGWDTLLRRQMENVAALFPFVVLFALPILFDIFSTHYLYEWTRPEVQKLKEYLEKAPYLNVPFFSLRAVLYFCFFSIVSWFFRKQSCIQDGDGNPLHSLKLKRIAYPVAVLFGFLFTFFAIDWAMSLEFRWSSTVWAFYLFTGAAGASLSLWILILLGLRKFGYLLQMNAEHYHLLGKLLFAFTALWAYLAFSQYMLIWYGNIPEETDFFIKRNYDGWFYVSLLLVIGRFALPFLFLLPQATKKNERFLAMVASWVLFMQAVELYWIVMPMEFEKKLVVGWMEILIVVGMGLVFLSGYLRNASTVCLYPIHDPRLQESIEVYN
ncbi:hypothetical protein A7K93_04355 [Candidatus Methylacidiphilum fumarolicum]|uniref:Quinol:cytochrome C oxidoreductase n=2 Tax=Candidatus Methylacidiphilum fumarolicum TaxID=591154 RepID=I0JZ55_METFB|nr:hypothetical protein [Candidatus Methylacidiphilum fumarolicum]MBW6414680.1 hypothetical protein [Candidatus Methylacidiphilum fumarolicum]TFE70182.1 hypothetical protein A7K73_04720 [Candidatus Methylacidiphilum fumarolicum]TFE74251.1 hypothetical protein A7K93_04355 [Candidatus Methylacidiphilum fumarolicum]TFE75750.1 hypothetical protein A7K72_01035 [Candidatus Methylacidiphilum fumarolicum]TFE75909.1 hypothetical protein A7D33_01240 [Candidatus Methylacidiphilum fumarolicum]